MPKARHARNWTIVLLGGDAIRGSGANRLAAVRKMENYFRWLMNIVASLNDNDIQRSMVSVSKRTCMKELLRRCPLSRHGAVALETRRISIYNRSYGNVILASRKHS